MLISLLILPFEMLGQFTGTVTSTESTCQANGTIKVSDALSTSEYALTGSTIPQIGPFVPEGGEVLFTDIPKGTYTVTEFKEDNTQPTVDILVPGNYQQNWTWTAVPTYSPCTGGTPTVKIHDFNIINATLLEQRPPFTYRISTKMELYRQMVRDLLTFYL